MSTYFAPSVERLLGYTPDEALALELESLLTPDSLERVRATLADGIQGAERGDVIGLRVTEVNQCHKDGSIVPVEVTDEVPAGPGWATAPGVRRQPRHHRAQAGGRSAEGEAAAA